MREILFRGKQADNGEWIFGNIVHQTDYYGDRCDRWFILEGDYTYDYDIGYPIEVQKETVGQYTGLKDKNGKKIFEHDILKAYDPLDKRYFIGVVKYFDASFYICDTKSVPCYFGEYCFTDFEVEVIGNIFDNPELLEVEEHE